MKRSLFILILTLIGLSTEFLFGQDSYIDGVTFSEEHRAFLDANPEFAELILTVWQKNKEQTERFIERYKTTCSRLAEQALKRGDIHSYNYFLSIKTKLDGTYHYIVFPFISANLEDIFYLYCALPTSRTALHLFRSFRDGLHPDLQESADRLFFLYCHNAARIAKRTWSEKNRYAKDHDATNARLVMTFRNIHVLTGAIDYLSP